MHECSGGSCGISCVHLLSPGWGGAGGRRDGEIILSVPRASPSESGSSQILSLSPSSHLGNGNLYLQTVGAGGEREILKSSLPSPPTPFHSSAWPARPLAFFPTPPCALFISASASLRRSPLGFCRPPPPPTFFISPALERASERIQPPHLCSCVCIPRLLVTRGSRSTGFSGS